jgi:putative nucleotidyltransferase with HDIG domain
MLYTEALDLMNKYGNGAPWVKHCFAVSQLATHLSNVFAAKCAIHIEFIRSASLLHDIGRYKSCDPILHGVEGYKLLSSLGYRDEAFICASHILYGLSSAEAAAYGLPEQDFIPIRFEEKLIPLVDFLVEHDRAVSLDKRFKSLRLRNEANKDFLVKLDKAELAARTFMHKVNTEFAISVEELATRILKTG